jgi:hypothetical protein
MANPSVFRHADSGFAITLESTSTIDSRENAAMGKTAEEVIEEVFGAAEVDGEAAPFAAALRAAWEAGDWSDEVIEAILRADETG